MKRRLLTGLLLAAVLFPLIFVPAMAFQGVITVLLVVAVFELAHLYRRTSPLPLEGVVYMLVSALALFAAVLFSVQTEHASLWIFVTVSAVSLVGLSLMLFSERLRFETFTRLFFGAFYLSFTFAALSLVHTLGALLFIYLLILTIITDIFAYFIGISLGRHKLAPQISPKKTVEGFLGGMAIAVAIATVFATVLDISPFPNLLVLILVGVFISVAAQLGDLAASRMKRAHGAKDFSNLFPGHGGVLDRFDSTLFAALVFTLVLFAAGVF